MPAKTRRQTSAENAEHGSDQNNSEDFDPENPNADQQEEFSDPDNAQHERDEDRHSDDHADGSNPADAARQLAANARDYANGTAPSHTDANRFVEIFQSTEARGKIIVELAKILRERECVLDEAQHELIELKHLRDCRQAADHTLFRRLTTRTLNHDATRHGQALVPPDSDPLVRRRRLLLEANAQLLMSSAGLLKPADEILADYEDRIAQLQNALAESRATNRLLADRQTQAASARTNHPRLTTTAPALRTNSEETTPMFYQNNTRPDNNEVNFPNFLPPEKITLFNSSYHNNYKVSQNSQQAKQLQANMTRVRTQQPETEIWQQQQRQYPNDNYGEGTSRQRDSPVFWPPKQTNRDPANHPVEEQLNDSHEQQNHDQNLDVEKEIDQLSLSSQKQDDKDNVSTATRQHKNKKTEKPYHEKHQNHKTKKGEPSDPSSDDSSSSSDSESDHDRKKGRHKDTRRKKKKKKKVKKDKKNHKKKKHRSYTSSSSESDDSDSDSSDSSYDSDSDSSSDDSRRHKNRKKYKDGYKPPKTPSYMKHKIDTGKDYLSRHERNKMAASYTSTDYFSGEDKNPRRNIFADWHLPVHAILDGAINKVKIMKLVSLLKGAAREHYSNLPDKARTSYKYICAELNARFISATDDSTIWYNLCNFKMKENEPIEEYITRANRIRTDYNAIPRARNLFQEVFKVMMHEGLHITLRERLENHYPGIKYDKKVDLNGYSRTLKEQYAIYISTINRRKEDNELKKVKREEAKQQKSQETRATTEKRVYPQRDVQQNGGGQRQQWKPRNVPPHQSQNPNTQVQQAAVNSDPRVMATSNPQEPQACFQCQGTNGCHKPSCKTLHRIQENYRQRQHERANAAVQPQQVSPFPTYAAKKSPFGFNTNKNKIQQSQVQQVQSVTQPVEVLPEEWKINTVTFVGTTSNVMHTNIQLPDHMYSLEQDNYTNPPSLGKPINVDTYWHAINQLEARHRAEKDEKYLKERQVNSLTLRQARDEKACTMALNVAGVVVIDVLLDSGAQPNIVSIATLFRLGCLKTGGGIRDAMRGMVKDLALTSHILGIGGAKIRIIGQIRLPIIISSTKTIDLKFLVTCELKDVILIGTPGLRDLGFTLKSPNFGKRDFLDPNQRPTPEEEVMNDPTREEKLVEKASINEPDAILEQEKEELERNIKKNRRKQKPKVTQQSDETLQPKRRGRPPKKEEETRSEPRDSSPEVEVRPPKQSTLQEKMQSSKQLLEANQHITIDDEGNFKPMEDKPVEVKATRCDENTYEEEENTDEQDFHLTGEVELENLF